MITGSGQGVGEGIARGQSMEQMGYWLAESFLKVEAVADDINKAGGSAIAIECDVKK